MTLRAMLSAGSAGRNRLSYTPPTPPPSITDEVAVWWAGDLGLSNGASVSSWTDRVSSIELTQSGSNRPTFSNNGIGGQASVNFDSTSSQYMTYSAANPISTSTDGCMVAVLNIQSSSLQAVWNTANTASVEFLQFQFGSYTASIYQYQFFVIEDNDGAVSSSTDFIYEVSSNDSYWSFFYDNNSRDSAHFDNSGAWFGDTSNRNIFRLGAGGIGSATNFLDGDIAYLGFFDSPLSSGDRISLYNWIASTYGITIP